ncbi:hypothetical protein EJB05_11528 [Eragrostis curvula]|uniref:GIY-YIG domain-containing protein n=1 Tax=Eragrostis curvula TaxID=38414 RepID=A0A5J9VP79_9POAL|nr:hypothetical protein EJB05_11528 [Eragrostis curvula]
MPAATAAVRLKREDCPRTKHDSLFSPWKVLVGPSDWEDHAAGKEGVQRYRTRNLPDNFPGLYELGVAGASDEGLRTRGRDSRSVVVVYLGQADSVRARLQQYGRSGSHLDTGNSAGKDEVSALATGTGLFREVFARGYSVVFRCALMDNKQEAEKTEAQLLRVFDYAWNKLQNGACRREEVLLKLERISYRSSLLSRVRHMKQTIFGEKAGIKIKGSGSVDTPSGIMRSMLPRVHTFVRFRPHLVNSDDGEGETIDIPWNRTYQGNTFGNRQAHGRRSEGYKVKRIDVAKRRTVPIQYFNSVCGVVLEDGSSCLEEPVQGRKRCNLHKGRRIKGSLNCSSSSPPCQVEVSNAKSVPRQTENLNNSDHAQESELMSKNLATALKEQSRQSSCFEAKEVKTGEAPTEDGTHETAGESGIYGQKSFHAESQSQVEQASGRMWFQLLKAQTKSVSTHPARGPGCQTRIADDITAISGATKTNGTFETVPNAGKTRCEKLSEVKGTSFSRSSGWPCTCGARTSDGSPCMNQPVEGRKRCALHKGQRAPYPPIPLIE